MPGTRTGPDDRLYAFGPFVADLVTGTLRRDGVQLAVSLKSLDVLRALIERRAQLVEKDTLLALVWPDTIVEENTLARHISNLRKVFNDNPHDHQFIVTVPGRGYRFVAPIEEFCRGDGDRSEPVESATADSADAPADLGSALLPPQHRAPAAIVTRLSPSRLRGITATAASIAAVLVAGIVLLANFSEPQRDARDRTLWRLTSGGGLESDATWAPNGRTIAYSSDRYGNFDIWAQPLGGGHAVRVTSSIAHDWQPSWSPDGRLVVFRSERDGGGLFVVPATGGTERQITSFGYHPQWSRGEPRILFYSSDIVRSKLYIVGPDGSQLRRVLSGFLEDFSWYRAAWHPDGHRISILGAHRHEGVSFWITPFDSDSPTRVRQSAAVSHRLRKIAVNLGAFNWSPQGDALYFEGQSQEAVNIWRVRVDPETLQWMDGPDRLTLSGALDTNIALSTDGQKLAFTVRTENTRLWSFPFDPIAGRVQGRGEPMSAAGADALYPDVAANGSQIVYRTIHRGRQELHRQSLAGGAVQLLTAGEELTAPRLSDDGTLLAFRRLKAKRGETSQKESAIVLVSTDGSNERLLTTPGVRSLTPYDWSPDSAWIVGGCEHGPAGRWGVCLLPVSGAPRAQEQMRVIASDPDRNLHQATFSPNQKWIAFNATSPIAGLSTIYVVAAEGGPWTPISDGPFWDDKPRWAPDGNTVYFISNRSGFLNVWGRRFDPAAGKPEGEPFRVTNFDTPRQRVSSPVSTMELAVAPSQLILPMVEASGAVWVLENVDE